MPGLPGRDVLQEALAAAGIVEASDAVLQYLRAIGLPTAQAIATYLAKPDSIRELVGRLKTGLQYKGTEYKLEDETIVEAVIAQWMVFVNQASDVMAEIRAASTPAAAPSPHGGAAPPTSTASATSSSPDVVPKALPPGVYASLLEDYNKVLVDGERRHFPEKTLLGAERTLARMHHEHQVSKLYTATPLGEILSQRIFTSFDTINSNRKKAPTEKKLTIDDKFNISEKATEEWEVRGLMMLIDAIEAMQWAWILLKYATETAVRRYTEWFTNLVRRHSQRVPNTKALWDSFAWEIAMRMRSNETFAAITEDLMADLTKVHDILNQSPVKKRTKWNDETAPKGKGRGGSQRWRRPDNNWGSGQGSSSWQPTSWTMSHHSLADPSRPQWPPQQSVSFAAYPQATWNPSPQLSSTPANAPANKGSGSPPWQQKGGGKPYKGNGKQKGTRKGGRK